MKLAIIFEQIGDWGGLNLEGIENMFTGCFYLLYKKNGLTPFEAIKLIIITILFLGHFTAVALKAAVLKHFKFLYR
jgi:hypothetical protein